MFTVTIYNQFTEWCLSANERVCSTPSSPHSLFEGTMSVCVCVLLNVLCAGLAGTTLFFSDVLTNLQSATFPAFEL